MKLYWLLIGRLTFGTAMKRVLGRAAAADLPRSM